MKEKRKIFIYPLTKEVVKPEGNNYILQLIRYLGAEFEFCNQVTAIGLFDAVLKFRKTDIYYFNWIEDVPTKRFGYAQVILLFFLLPICKVSGKKIIYFIHNNISHDKKHLTTKKFIVWLMFRYADLVLSHSNEAGDRLSKKKLNVFHHPIEQNKALLLNEPFQFDLLIWGKVSPYKGITEFVEHVAQSSVLRNYNILIAGKFDSDVHYQRIISTKPNNIVVRNQFVSEEEMVKLFQQSRFVLFTYISDSVLSSAALCKSLSYEKEVIGPNIGSFKDLGEKNLIYTYRTFSDLEALLTDLREKKKKRVEAAALRQYIGQTSWSDFSRFVISCIDNMYPERKKSIRGLSNVKIVANEQI